MAIFICHKPTRCGHYLGQSAAAERCGRIRGAVSDPPAIPLVPVSDDVGILPVCLFWSRLSVTSALHREVG